MAERKFRYDGPHDEVYIPALGQAAKRNHQIKVDDATIADSLAQQSDWHEIGGAAPPPAEAEEEQVVKGG